MAKNPKIELPLRNDFGILCDPKIVPNTNLDTVCFTLPGALPYFYGRFPRTRLRTVLAPLGAHGSPLTYSVYYPVMYLVVTGNTYS